MNVNKRDRRGIGVEREAVRRTPRSGGRATDTRTTITNVTSVADRGGRTRGAREFPTQGSAALRPQEQPQVSESSAEPAEIANPPAPRLKVAPPRPVAVPRAPFVATILVLVVGGVLGILVVNTKINENAFRLDNLQNQQQVLDVQQQKLEREIAENATPGNLTARAKQLGLVESGQPAYIRLPDGQVIGIPQPADGEPSITSQQGVGR